MAVDVQLRRVAVDDHEHFFAMFAVYLDELEPFVADRASAEASSFEAYRAAILEDLDPGSGRELWWIDVSGAHAGLAITRTLPDWPDDSTDVAEITEFYVEPRFRRSGVGRAAVEAILADHRARGTRLVEAAILEGNGAGRAFWAALGFEVRSVLTGRAP